MPLTLGITAVGAHYLLGLGWIESLLIGAILAPTDPVFAAALVGNEKVPPRLRQLLNVESGVNDGLALPFVMLFLAIAAGSEDLHLDALGMELGLGVLIGVAVPWAAIKLERTRWFSASGIAAAQEVFQLVAVTIVLSILLHSSTDIVIARGFDDEREVPAWFGAARRLRGRSQGDSAS
ncbi:cation:proton antiporter domain-containing protein [Nonomuraea sp. 3N208]|uniref:cation:proton antiporter domain-containing protein n=1 Tax=Nonomuraea sp. 3N208 TaxID=3457421 RepID=UPI003FD5D0D7